MAEIGKLEVEVSAVPVFDALAVAGFNRQLAEMLSDYREAILLAIPTLDQASVNACLVDFQRRLLSGKVET